MQILVVVLMAMGLLAGCSSEKFAMEAKSGQRGAGSTVQLDGKEGVMTIMALAPDHPEGIKYHVTKANEVKRTGRKATGLARTPCTACTRTAAFRSPRISSSRRTTWW